MILGFFFQYLVKLGVFFIILEKNMLCHNFIPCEISIELKLHTYFCIINKHAYFVELKISMK